LSLASETSPILVDAGATQVLGEDPSHDRPGDRVDLEPVRALTKAAFAGLGCGPASTRR
jgi:hypothetical protein